MIFKKILAALAGIDAVFSAVFFVLFIQGKQEKKLREEEYKREKAEIEKEAAKAEAQKVKQMQQNIVKKEKEDEMLVEELHSGDGLSSFDAGISLLRDKAENGRKRNSR